jgi:photosystem II oxygen-evolving enhancer protein 3
MEGMQWKGCVCRIRKCMFDFISMEDDLIDDDEDSWDLIGRELRLKATFLYCDLNQVISNARDADKKSLTDLANKLFYFMEEVTMHFSLSLSLSSCK